MFACFSPVLFVCWLILDQCARWLINSDIWWIQQKLKTTRGNSCLQVDLGILTPTMSGRQSATF